MAFSNTLRGKATPSDIRVIRSMANLVYCSQTGTAAGGWEGGGVRRREAEGKERWREMRREKDGEGEERDMGWEEKKEREREREI